MGSSKARSASKVTLLALPYYTLVFSAAQEGILGAQLFHPLLGT
jgi:hypothetical protein